MKKSLVAWEIMSYSVVKDSDVKTKKTHTQQGKKEVSKVKKSLLRGEKKLNK